MAKTKLVTKVDAMIEGMLDRLEKIEKFTVDQLPDLCKEILAERRVEIENNIIVMAVISAIVLPVVITLIVMTFTQSWEQVRNLTGIGALLLGMFNVTALADILHSFLKLRALKVAPKLFIVSRLHKMIAGK